MARKKNNVEASQEEVQFVTDETEIPQETAGKSATAEAADVKHRYGLPGILQTRMVNIKRLYGSENAENDTYVTAVIALENDKEARIRLPAYVLEDLQQYRTENGFENVPLRGGLTTTMDTDENGVTRPKTYFNPRGIGGNVDRDGILSMPEENGIVIIGEVNNISKPSEKGFVAITMTVASGPFKEGKEYIDKDGNTVQPHYHAGQTHTIWVHESEQTDAQWAVLRDAEAKAKAYRLIRNDDSVSKEEKAHAYKEYKDSSVILAGSGTLKNRRSQDGYHLNPTTQMDSVVAVMPQKEYNEARKAAKASQQDENMPQDFDAPSTGMRM